jgi:O-antigen/teichoic acid export membrane protein
LFALVAQMKKSRIAELSKGVGWTVGAYGLNQLIRFGTSIVLTRLLAPDLFGTMVIVNSLRTGIDLVLDVGIGQNIVQNRSGDLPSFYNTAWSIQLVRGILICLICWAISAPLATLYDKPVLISILPVAGIYFVFSGFTSPAQFLLQRRLQLAKLSAFETLVTILGTLVQLIIAYFYPNIWSLILGGVISAAISMIASFFLLPTLRYRFYFSKRYTTQILNFGKWIFISSIIYFLSMNFDRLSLGNLVPLELLGIYGIARSISDLMASIFIRLSQYIIFPLIASAAHTSRSILRSKIAPIRFGMLLIIIFGISLICSGADVIVKALFDARYHAAGSLLPILVIGVWFSILCAINEATLLGLGKPLYGAAANALKLLYLVIGLPISFMHFGIVGAAVLVALGDLCRYPALLFGQVREQLSFGAQDLLLTFSLASFICTWEFLRWELGYGTSFDSMAHLVMAKSHFFPLKALMSVR